MRNPRAILALLIAAALLGAAGTEAARTLPALAPAPQLEPTSFSAAELLTSPAADTAGDRPFRLISPELFSFLTSSPCSMTSRTTCTVQTADFRSATAEGYRLYLAWRPDLPQLEPIVSWKTASGDFDKLAETKAWVPLELAWDLRRPTFQGLWTDPVTGLSYARNRWYDARTASWLSTDPLGPVDSQNLYAFVGWAPHMGTDPMGAGKGKVIGWVLRRTNGRLIRFAPIFTEKQAGKYFLEGFDVLVKGGRSQAKRVASKVIPRGRILRHARGAHILRGGGESLAHYQDTRRHGIHIFYSILGAILANETAGAFEDSPVQFDAIYTNVRPGQSIAHMLTATYWAGEDSILSYADWVNPGELVAMGGDFGRWIEREWCKELVGLVVTIRDENGIPAVAFNLDAEGELLSVVKFDSDSQIMYNASEFYAALENGDGSVAAINQHLKLALQSVEAAAQARSPKAQESSDTGDSIQCGYWGCVVNGEMMTN